MGGIKIGAVTHYYGNIGVAVIGLTDTIRVGDTIHFFGSTTDFRQQVDSLQIEHENLEEVAGGQDVAIKVTRKVRGGDRVYKLTEEQQQG